ncbi:hypothetical protein [Streptomyces sp. NPDC055243]|uniref:hypothetical protein n=1 Tax=Streptomyces sp. NPDC055243 TaxID=3365720 RepID=UPI0037CEFC0D
MPHTSAPPTSGDGRREANAAAVLRAALDQSPVPRSAIARGAGLSPAAVSRQGTDLARIGLIREVPGLVAAGGAGRPQIPVDLTSPDGGGPVAAGVHIGVPQSTFCVRTPPSAWRTCVADLRGRVLSHGTLRPEGTPAAELPDAVGRAPAAFLAERTAGGPVLGGPGGGRGRRRSEPSEPSERIVGPHVQPAVLPVAAATVPLRPLFRGPLRALREAAP